MAGERTRTRPPPGREIAVGLTVFAGYSVVAGAAWAGREQAAQRHAHDVQTLERRLHVDVEPALNRWLAPHGLLRVLANYEYATTYVLSAFLLLLWLWLRRPDVYRSARSSFVLLNVLGIAGFLLYPLMPPRLVPGAGFVDTVRLGHTWARGDRRWSGLRTSWRRCRRCTSPGRCGSAPCWHGSPAHGVRRW